MIEKIIFSWDSDPLSWAEIESLRQEFGSKAATLATLPRLWTPPFALVSAGVFEDNKADLNAIDGEAIDRLRHLAAMTGVIYVRSSIVGEMIWDRGSYESVPVRADTEDFVGDICSAIRQVLDSAPKRRVGIVMQSYLTPRGKGEFGNLLRISKTRDHWELSSDYGGLTSRVRLNAQRDEAANPRRSLEIKPGMQRERLFGSIAAWLNNDLLRGVLQRVNCEWIETSDDKVYLVQVDQEDEDVSGVNPFNVRIGPFYRPASVNGRFLRAAEGDALKQWDKLRVLEELWEPDAANRPTLFYVPFEQLPRTGDADGLQNLEEDFRSLIGPDGIVIRTSGHEKALNLRRTEGLTPDEAARRCLAVRDQMQEEEGGPVDLAFVVHRFIAARASAWARADPQSPIVEIHSLWGLPDALQYCPYDIWEVHVPTELATEYTEYKSNMLLAHESGNWEYVRIRNDLGRSLSIGRKEALDLATRTRAIADRLGKACHVMWFVGCVDDKGLTFNLPWYWTEAHDTERNSDRSNYKTITIADRDDLDKVRNLPAPRSKLALELMPTDQELMRDMKFIDAVGNAALELSVPVMLAGSTLAHAYFALRRLGCAVIATGEKDHTRVRRSVMFGKIVRDRIPGRIANRQEAEITRKIPNNLKKGFLISKLLEEALEVRNARTIDDKRGELADLFEIIRSLAQADNIQLDEVVDAADRKRALAGGFDEGLILLKTGILGRDRESMQPTAKALTQVLGQQVSGDTYALPFTFFGFMEEDKPRAIIFEDLGIRIDVTLRKDRIELQASLDAEQLELPLEVPETDDSL
ncbi:hypothetical protein AB4Z01_00725 [Inquilinus sp. YAF38]|uniref:hypothetical protein n=1 Tax=Inquilinus sp. YAF38 TaxID=3233084 RepID=UPI003F9390CF